MNGEGAAPLYKCLAENTKFEGFGKGPKALMMSGVAKAMNVPAEMGKCVNLEAEEASELYRLLYKILGGIGKDGR